MVEGYASQVAPKAFERLIDTLGKVRLPALEQRKNRFGDLVAADYDVDTLSDQLRHTLATEPSRTLECALLRLRQIDGRSLYAVHVPIRLIRRVP
jgi:hypothetical protein